MVAHWQISPKRDGYPHSGTKDIRSGGGVTAGREDLTDDGDIVCVAVNIVLVTTKLHKMLCRMSCNRHIGGHPGACGFSLSFFC